MSTERKKNIDNRRKLLQDTTFDINNGLEGNSNIRKERNHANVENIARRPFSRSL